MGWIIRRSYLEPLANLINALKIIVDLLHSKDYVLLAFLAI